MVTAAAATACDEMQRSEGEDPSFARFWEAYPR